MEPPIPHGLAALPNQAKDLLTFFTVDPLLVDAAAFGIPNFDSQRSQADSVGAWLTSIADARQTEIIQRLLSEDPFALKCELLSEIRDSQQAVEWPAEPPHRTITQLLETCESLRQKKNEKLRRESAAKAKREADRAEKQRRARMKEMRSDPKHWLAEASKLVEARGTDNYKEAASILADLRDAVGGETGNTIARKHATLLAKKYPTLNVLKSSLRKKQLLD